MIKHLDVKQINRDTKDFGQCVKYTCKFLQYCSFVKQHVLMDQNISLIKNLTNSTVRFKGKTSIDD